MSIFKRPAFQPGILLQKCESPPTSPTGSDSTVWIGTAGGERAAIISLHLAFSSSVHQNGAALTLGAYRTGLLNYFKHRITSGAVEGLINKIKTLKRQAYGFRDPEYFKLRLYHLHTQRYALAG